MSHPSSSSAYGIWSLNEIRDAERVDNWPELPPEAVGTPYATSYLATTGGSLINATPGSLDTVIDNASDGDAILLESGAYTINATPFGSYTSDPFRQKNILICGAASAEYVVVTVDHDGTSAVRDHPVFSGSDSSHTSTVNRQMAFLTFLRQQTSTLNYSSSLVYGNGAPSPIGRMVNCYFDSNNGNLSWHYDNTASTTIDVEFVRCTFANYATWQASYTGRDDVLTVTSCLFDDTTDTTEYVNGGGNVVSATVDTTARTYDTATYATAGHLYVPNTTAVF